MTQPRKMARLINHSFSQLKYTHLIDIQTFGNDLKHPDAYFIATKKIAEWDELIRNRIVIIINKMLRRSSRAKTNQKELQINLMMLAHKDAGIEVY